MGQRMEKRARKAITIRSDRTAIGMPYMYGVKIDECTKECKNKKTTGSAAFIVFTVENCCPYAATIDKKIIK